MIERAQVLILTEDVGEDPCVTSVVRELEARGAQPRLVATRHYPADVPLVMGDEEMILGGYSLREMRSLWVRKIEPALPEDLEPSHREAALGQASVALWGMLEAAPVFQVDPPEVLVAASTKPSVSRLARRLGMEVPRELVTNNPAALRNFAKSCPNGVICKLVDSGSVSLRRNGVSSSFPTTLMSAEELEDPVGLELAPMIFQERVEKVRELRLTVVGSQIFAVSLDPGEVLDWRMDPSLVASVRPYADLPAEVEQRVFALLDRLGLNFATVDILITPEGRHVFLEVNAVSYFDHAEHHAGQPISAALAELLLGIRPPRVRHPGRELGP